MFLAVGVALLLGGASVQAQTQTPPQLRAEVFERGLPDRVLFDFEGWDQPDSSVSPHSEQRRFLRSIYRTRAAKDSKGQLRPSVIAMEETAKVDGHRIQVYTYEIFQTGQRARVDVKNGLIHYTYQEHGGAEQKGSEPWVDHFVIGPTLLSYLRAHWKSAVEEQKPLKVMFGLPERQDSYEFEFNREGIEKTADGRTRVRMSLQPTAFFLKLFVGKIKFVFDGDTQKLLEIDGRNRLKKISEGSDRLEDFKAVILFK